jgi:uncharacterized protein involved in exopolysaccharide biosynthesis
MTPGVETALEADGDISIGDLLQPLVRAWKLLVVLPLAIGAAGVGVSYLVPPTFTARASFLSPQPPGGAAAALASLGNLANLAGVGAPSRSPAEQYAALMGSVTVADRLIDHFELLKVYEVQMKVDARRMLENNTRISIGKKDGLIVIETDDRNPQRAADIANRYIEELRSLTARLALSEAQQRRVFFEGLMSKARDDLLKAQVALQATGFNQGALRAEPRAAADAYARTRAEVSALEVRLAAMSQTLTDKAPEVQRTAAQLEGMRVQLARIESTDAGGARSDYLLRYREFKYQETLFELFARQYEAARVDEAHESTLIQVVDPAAPPERRSKPKRGAIGLATAAVAFVFLAAGVILRSRSRTARARSGG